MGQGSLPHAWWDVYAALLSACDAEPLVEGVRIVSVDQDEDRVRARDEAGSSWEGELLIGADGYRSVVRQYVDGARPHADYAGYATWLGQSELPEWWRDERAGGPDFFPAGRRMLAVYPLIEADGRVSRTGWGVIDPTWNRLFREIGALDGTRVRRTPRADDIPDEVYETMARVAEQQWDEPWASLVAQGFRSREVIATPITEYVPDRVVAGRVALVGDAAHAQTLMTGAGFREAVDDADALARALGETGAIADALMQYESMRLESMRWSVMGGQSFSRGFAA